MLALPYLRWCLSGQSGGTTITANGNSGTWGETAPASWPSSAVDLGRVDDVTIYVWATTVGGTGSPSLTVSLDLYDNSGHLIPGVLAVPAVTTAATPQYASAGRHAATAGTYLVLPQYARVSWVVSGTNPSFSGAEISVYGR